MEILYPQWTWSYVKLVKLIYGRPYKTRTIGRPTSRGRMSYVSLASSLLCSLRHGQWPSFHNPPDSIDAGPNLTQTFGKSDPCPSSLGSRTVHYIASVRQSRLVFQDCRCHSRKTVRSKPKRSGGHINFRYKCAISDEAWPFVFHDNITIHYCSYCAHD